MTPFLFIVIHMIALCFCYPELNKASPSSGQFCYQELSTHGTHGERKISLAYRGITRLKNIQ